MSDCPTTSGPYRCTAGDAGHGGPCETQAPEYRKRATVEERLEAEILRLLERLQASHGEITRLGGTWLP